MKKKVFFLMLFISFNLMSSAVSAENPYAKIDVYYNGQLYPGATTPKPSLDIGEPFSLRFDVTSYQRCYVSVKLTTIDYKDFQIINGSSKILDEYVGQIIEKNETLRYQWEVVPTDNWAGGSIPIDFVYQFDEFGEGGDILTKGRFTAAYITVSEEYYDDNAPAKTATNSTSEKPAKAPGFMLPVAIGMLLLAGICRRYT
ncbi:sarcinarray family MAST domain-containing protein [uncultured Methanomethylovorans sp.]|uniref:sarcinarray family MAST domain-containing protein n=1 Tax=uncultured Methanomethylovorans sp. TaxID=183759 RepID=UPI002AA72A6C|nr:sarcinarray family MAST domain-containing protein [uncultured Methanomethylovorans sp.]